MFPYRSFHARRSCTLVGVLVLGLCLTLDATAAPAEELTQRQRDEIYAPVQAWIGELKNSKNADGVSNKQGTYSRTPHKVDDATYEITVHVNTAGDTSQLTERYTLTVKKKPGASAWELAEAKVADTYTGLYRSAGVACYPFQKFSFNREGLKLGASAGQVCETYLEGAVSNFALQGADMTQTYAPPENAGLFQTGHDFYAVHQLMAKDHSRELDFVPASFLFACDGKTCEELLGSCFTGLERHPAGEVKPTAYGDATLPAWIRSISDKTAQERHDSAFAHFRSPDRPDHRYYSAYVARELAPPDYAKSLPGSGVVLEYDNWGGFEVEFSVFPRRLDLPDQLFGTIYGYYSEETAKTIKPYDIERREDTNSRWFEADSVKGTIELALEDEERIGGDIEFGLTLKKDLKELPFFIISFNASNPLGRDKPAPLFVNSIQMDGKELTWVRTGPISGLVILPQQASAGTKLKLRMNYSTKGLYKYTYSYSYVDRFGWMPFVRFGDFIDDFDLTIKSPAKYQILGIGQKVDERIEGEVLISHWTSDNPVVFPSIIFGRYRSEKSKFDAKRADGTVIPVAVHVDEASYGTWEITPDALQPIADQAANAINLFEQVSGLDYPYRELNLVNDAIGSILYGQAPSSLIYLGTGVFRGTGFLAPALAEMTGGRLSATYISKFMKSVVAHETGHQWWGSRISNANGRNYWFVESLAEYFSAIYIEAVYGWKEYEEKVEEWRREIVQTKLSGSVQNASALFSGSGGSYRASVYSRGPYAFHMLREMFKGEGRRGFPDPAKPDEKVADRKFFEFLKAFAQDLAKKREIVTLDIQESAEKALGGVGEDGKPYSVDLSWFFDQWIRGTGIPQYALFYEVRPAEEGSYIIEGRIKQRVVIGDSANMQELKGRYYRGLINLTVKGIKGGDYKKRIVVEGAETPFQLKVPQKPVEVALNQQGEILSYDVLVNRSW